MNTNEIYQIKIKKEYAEAVLKDLEKMKAIEICDIEIPKWQQEESNRRFQEMLAHPETNINLNDFFKELEKDNG
jgi:sugar phosphate isomerase/epimerase